MFQTSGVLPSQSLSMPSSQTSGLPGKARASLSSQSSSLVTAKMLAAPQCSVAGSP